jgi:hypothetical protein
MRSVKGFLADDGTYFDTAESAELYEALHALEFSVTNIGADPAKFMIVIEGCQDQLRRYLDAKNKYEESEATGPRPGNAQPVVNNTDNGRAEGDAPVLEQQVDKPEHVPDIRSGVGTEAVPDERKVDGAGGGGAHARSVRSAAYMATVSTAALATARGGSSNTFVQQAEARSKLSRADK